MVWEAPLTTVVIETLDKIEEYLYIESFWFDKKVQIAHNPSDGPPVSCQHENA